MISVVFDSSRMKWLHAFLTSAATSVQSFALVSLAYVLSSLLSYVSVFFY